MGNPENTASSEIASRSSVRYRMIVIHLLGTVCVCGIVIVLMGLKVPLWGAVTAGVLLAAASCVVMDFAAGRKISGSVRTLERRIRQMAALGDYTSEIPLPEGNDEIQALGESLCLLQSVQQQHMNDLIRVLGSISENNLDVTLHCDYPGDFHRQQEALVNIVNRLSASIRQINDSAVEISNASEQLSEGIQIVSRGTVSQTESVELLSENMSSIYKETHQNAENAARATQLSVAAGKKMMKGSERMAEMLEAMRQVNETSQQIGKVIKTVDDIAFQTNILALNASVEAARAGAAGKGFAVVADEVRNLANKSAEASQGTAGLIENELHAVEIGTRLVQETAKVFEEVMKDAKAATELTVGIAEAVRGQEDAIQKMKQEIDLIRQVVQSNSSTAQEGAAASEELSGQSQTLRLMMGKFHLLNVHSERSEKKIVGA